MAKNLPRTELGKGTLTKINAALPQFEEEVNPLAAMLGSKLPRLYQITTNPDFLAVHLQGMNMLKDLDISKIRALKVDFDKNQYIYNMILSDGLAAPKVIRAMEETGNERVIREFSAAATLAIVPSLEVRSIEVGAGNDSGNSGGNAANSKQPIITMQAKVTAKILQIKNSDEDFPEREFFRPHLGKFLNGTTDPDAVALKLFELGAFSQMQKDKVEIEKLDYGKNNIIYNHMSKAGLDERILPLLTALEKTGNKGMLKLINEIASS